MKNKFLYFILVMGFLTCGLIASIMGPALISIKKEIYMNYLQGGLIFSGQFLGMTLSVIISGYISDRRGKKIFLIAGSVILVPGLVLGNLSMSFFMLFSSILIIGIGFGIYVVGINSLSLDYLYEYSPENAAKTMNQLSSFFGVGAILGPLLVTVCVNYFDSWRIIFLILLFFPVQIIILLLKIKYKFTRNAITFTNVRIIFSDPFVWLIGVCIFLYVGMEVSMYGWIPSYYEKKFGFQLIPAQLTSALFWISMTAGRFGISYLLNKIGLIKYIVISLAGIIFLSVIWFLIPLNLLVLVIVLLIGLLFSCFFPTNLNLATREYPKNTGFVTSFASIFSSLGGFFIPTAIGKTADFFGITILPLMILFLSLIFIPVITTARMVKKMKK